MDILATAWQQYKSKALQERANNQSVEARDLIKSKRLALALQADVQTLPDLCSQHIAKLNDRKGSKGKGSQIRSISRAGREPKSQNGLCIHGHKDLCNIIHPEQTHDSNPECFQSLSEPLNNKSHSAVRAWPVFTSDYYNDASGHWGIECCSQPELAATS